MYGYTDSNASLTAVVKGLSLNQNLMQSNSSVYNVVGQINGKTIYGVNHVGSFSGWNDNFVVNLKDLEYDDLDFVVFGNDQQIGRGKMNFYEAIRNSQTPFSEKIQLRKAGNVVGYLNVDTIKSAREQIVGGLHPPKVSLRSGALVDDPVIQPVQPTNFGIQRVHANKLNFFSCMDARDMGWEFYPYQFETKLKPTTNSILQSALQGIQPNQTSQSGYYTRT